VSAIASRSNLHWTEWSYPWIDNPGNQRRSWEKIYESAQLRQDSFSLSEVRLSQFACTPTALATSKKPTCGGIQLPLTPTDTLFEQSIPMEEDQSMKEVLLALTSAQAKCTYREDTLRLKHIYDKKISLDWRELIATIHCTAWSAFTVETYTIPQTDYNDYEDYEDYDDLSSHTYNEQWKSTYHINDFRLQWH
jgi:hypothetical protein